MIQRKQSLYLLLVTLLSLVATWFIPLWKANYREVLVFDMFRTTEMILMMIPILFLLSGIIALIVIFLFQNRKRQLALNRINLLINLILVGVLLYYLLTLPGENTISEKGIGVFVPVVNILLLLLANNSIQKDENLVKSVDRLR